MDVREVPGPEYEAAVMAAAEKGEPAPQDIRPPDDYAMSDRFKQWLVEAMRSEVMDQVSGAGLDRMAILRPSDEP